MLKEKPKQEPPTVGELHLLQRKRLTDRHEFLLAKIMRENTHKSKYWILGKVNVKRKNRRTTIRPHMKAYDVKPEIQGDSYLYEVDNTAGTKTLLWVMHPNNKLSIPVINKSISVADNTGVVNLPPK